MNIWICNHCHAEIPQEQSPKQCPLCTQHQRGFDQLEKEDEQDPEDKKYSELYEKTMKKLEEYDEGCEPQTLKYSCEE